MTFLGFAALLVGAIVAKKRYQLPPESEPLNHELLDPELLSEAEVRRYRDQGLLS